MFDYFSLREANPTIFSLLSLAGAPASKVKQVAAQVDVTSVLTGIKLLDIPLLPKTYATHGVALVNHFHSMTVAKQAEELFRLKSQLKRHRSTAVPSSERRSFRESLQNALATATQLASSLPTSQPQFTPLTNVLTIDQEEHVEENFEENFEVEVALDLVPAPALETFDDLQNQEIEHDFVENDAGSFVHVEFNQFDVCDETTEISNDLQVPHSSSFAYRQADFAFLFGGFDDQLLVLPKALQKTGAKLEIDVSWIFDAPASVQQSEPLDVHQFSQLMDEATPFFDEGPVMLHRTAEVPLLYRVAPLVLSEFSRSQQAEIFLATLHKVASGRMALDRVSNLEWDAIEL